MPSLSNLISTAYLPAFCISNCATFHSGVNPVVSLPSNQLLSELPNQVCYILLNQPYGSTDFSAFYTALDTTNVTTDYSAHDCTFWTAVLSAIINTYSATDCTALMLAIVGTIVLTLIASV